MNEHRMNEHQWWKTIAWEEIESEIEIESEPLPIRGLVTQPLPPGAAAVLTSIARALTVEGGIDLHDVRRLVMLVRRLREAPPRALRFDSHGWYPVAPSRRRSRPRCERDALVVRSAAAQRWWKP